MKNLKWPARVWSAGAAFVMCGALALPAFSQAPASDADASNEVLSEPVLQILGIDKEQIDPPAGASAKTEETAGKVKAALEEGVRAFASQNGPAAIAAFEKARTEDASLAPATLYFAKLCFATNNEQILNTGRTALETTLASEKDRDTAEAYYLFGRLALAGGRLADADLHFQKALSLSSQGGLPSAAGGEGAKPDDAATKRQRSFLKDIYANQVQVALARRSMSEAESLVNSWLALDADDAQALFRRGQIMYQSDPKSKSKQDEARKDLEKAYQLSVDAQKKDPNAKPDDLAPLPPPELVMIQLHTANQKTKEAEEEVTKLKAEIESKYGANKKEAGRIYSSLAMWYMQTNKAGEAQVMATEAMKADPKAPALQKMSALMRYFTNDPTVKEDFAKMANAEPGDFMVTNTLALILAESDSAEDKAKAVQLAEMNARLNQNSADALSTLCWVYYSVERTSEALQVYNLLVQAVQNGAQLSGDTAYFMARVVVLSNLQNKFEAATQLLQLAKSSQGTFKHRAEAEKWLEDLTGKSSTKPAPATGSTLPKIQAVPTPAGGGTTPASGTSGTPNPGSGSSGNN